MERWHDGAPVTVDLPAAVPEHAKPALPCHGPNGGPPEGDNYGPGTRFDVTHESLVAGVDGLGRWPNTGRTAGERIGHEELGFEESSLGYCLPQHVARSPPERLSLVDLLRTGGLADEDDAARWIAAGPDCRAAVWTAGAVVDGQHGASVARSWRPLRTEWHTFRCIAPFEGAWAAVGHDAPNVRTRHGITWLIPRAA